MASDRGLGLVAGYQAACDIALWVTDYFHEFRDLFELLHQLERKAYAAIVKEHDAAHKFAHAKGESNLAKRLQQYDTAHHACEQAIALYDQFALLLHLLREALYVCSPHSRLRTVENVRSELMLLLACSQNSTVPPLPQHSSPFTRISMTCESRSNKSKRLHSPPAVVPHEP